MKKLIHLFQKIIYMLPADYPYLYKKLENSQILLEINIIGELVNESLLTFMTSKSLIEKYWE